ncbi:DUF3899 domain-containing protein [Liquorilactobacillus mali]|uniref:DUF3899 domain-containing protein n=1 Tax=Liquorilactobacillus mali TaxID=1618 RepID=A0A0R2FEX5_9LACO|nr:DUF3899 domain-containing protein [Liquorilactobacillus mali]KRN27129.1 hypothetical protein IV36_GL001124 [Liquorilactobacillus mali]MDN7146020.1 DUF3899 domain-containing protein [Liquorilactobacillus mali]
MNRFKQKYYFKSVTAIQLVGIILMGTAALGIDKIMISNILFMVGLAAICVMIVDILLGAHLLAGWFKHKKKGETDDEYQQAKINVREVGSIKNQPIHFSKVGKSASIIGVTYIVLSIIITL